MAKKSENQKLKLVVNAISAAGYDPYAQLTGYVTTGNAAYITRQGDARAMVCGLDKAVIRGYLADNSQMRMG